MQLLAERAFFGNIPGMSIPDATLLAANPRNSALCIDRYPLIRPECVLRFFIANQVKNSFANIKKVVEVRSLKYFSEATGNLQ